MPQISFAQKIKSFFRSKMILLGLLSVVVVQNNTIAGAETLFDALFQGDIAHIQEMLKKQPEFANEPDKDGKLPIQWAVDRCSFPLVKVLLESGAKVQMNNSSPVDDRSPLNRAVSSCDAEVVKLLLNHGADVHSQSSVDFDWTPLHYAARRPNNETIMDLLLKSGADINAQTPAHPGTPLALAVTNNNSSAVKFLLEHGAQVNVLSVYGTSLLSEAARTADKSISDLLIAHGADQGDSLIMAVSRGKKDIVEALLKNWAKVNGKDSPNPSVLIAAVREGSKNMEVIRLLIEKGAAVNGQDQNGLTPLASADEVSVAQFLVEHGARVNQNIKGETAFSIDVQKGNKALLEFLVSKGAKINLPGLVALGRMKELSKYSPQKEFVVYKSLLDWNLLHVAALYGQVEAGKFLIDQGVALNARDKSGNAPIHFAVQKGYLDFVRMLIEHKADLNIQNAGRGYPPDGLRTPLHVAILNKDQAMVELLSQGGADENIKDEMGRTPAQLRAQVLK